jgi:hypothetical protein
MYKPHVLHVVAMPQPLMLAHNRYHHVYVLLDIHATPSQVHVNQLLYHQSQPVVVRIPIHKRVEVDQTL